MIKGVVGLLLLGLEIPIGKVVTDPCKKHSETCWNGEEDTYVRVVESLDHDRIRITRAWGFDELTFINVITIRVVSEFEMIEESVKLVVVDSSETDDVWLDYDIPVSVNVYYSKVLLFPYLREKMIFERNKTRWKGKPDVKSRLEELLCETDVVCYYTWCLDHKPDANVAGE